MTYLLGALAPKRPFGLSTLGTYASGKLPDPPSFVHPVDVEWGMLGNGPDDTLTVNDGQPVGDCTCAGAVHALMAWNVEVSEHDSVPDSNQTVETYFDLTGGADSGCVEADVLQRWHTDGLWGNKIAGYAPVEVSNLTEVQQTIAFYGIAYIGVALPQSAQEQFANGTEWFPVPGSPIEGGHCIVACGYDRIGIQCVSWGQIVTVTWQWFARYVTEVWAIVPHAFVEAGHGPALDLVSLQRDLAAL